MAAQSNPASVPEWETTEKINTFLSNIPSLDFSSTGIENIASRYRVSIGTVNDLVNKARGKKRKK